MPNCYRMKQVIEMKETGKKRKNRENDTKIRGKMRAEKGDECSKEVCVPYL